MKKHYEIQKTLAAVALFIVTLAVVLHFLVLGPLIGRNRVLQSGNKKQQEDLERQTGQRWELNPDSLSKVRQQYEKYRGDYLLKLMDVLGRADKEFEPLTDPFQHGIKFQDWRVSVTLFDYQERFAKAKRELERENVFLNEEYLGLAEASAPPEGREEYTYRLVARLYVVEEVAKLLRRNGLRLDNPKYQPKGGTLDPGRPAAMIQSLPVRVYVPDVKAEPFAEEYPVKVTVRGRLPDLCHFLDSLAAGNRFLLLDRIWVTSAGVDNFLKPGFNMQAQEEIEATIICSGFMVLQDIEKLRAEKATIKSGERHWTPGA